MIKFLFKLAIGLGILCACAALVFGLFGSVSELADSFSHFRHVGVAGLVALVIVGFLIGLRRWSGFGFAVVLALLVMSYPHLPFTGPRNSTGQFRLVQFNTLFKNPTPAKSVSWILEQKPDFVTLQEVSSNTMTIYDALALELPYGVTCKFAGVGGVAIRSKHEIAAQHCEEGQGFAWAQVKVKGKMLTVSSLHLHWPYPFGQKQQIEKLKPLMAVMPQPVVLAGDFNAAPWSAAVKMVEQHTQSKAVGGYRTTLWLDVLHNGKPWPALPIDHVLLPKNAIAQAAQVGPGIGSDHRPVVVDFDF